ncbi:MAG: N-acetylmuramoyl-L-alanine amidase [Candidatus Limimorpha sp.]
MKILIDNGHGKETPGKRSPDGKFREYLYTREIAEAIEKELKSLGIDAERIVPEMEDITLEERVRRVNDICDELGSSSVVFISIHCNASKNGEWGTARGWSAYTTKGTTMSDELATMLYVEAAKHFAGQTLRKEFSDGDPDWEEDFYVLRKTKCPAVLTENFFMDNEQDLAYLTSEEGREAIVRTHVDALIDWVNKYGKD